MRLKASHPRNLALRWLARHRGLTEQPYGSNRDNRHDGITAAQQRLGAYLVGLAWCGVWFASALIAAGVAGVTGRLASVAACEDDARAGRAPFKGFTTDHRKARRGDGVILFGRGIHIATLRRHNRFLRALGLIQTEEGNTSSGNAGDQSNGGGSYKRYRRLSDVYGYCQVNYPSPRPKRRRKAHRHHA